MRLELIRKYLLKHPPSPKRTSLGPAIQSNDLDDFEWSLMLLNGEVTASITERGVAPGLITC
jgi:hypothetical protein